MFVRLGPPQAVLAAIASDSAVATVTMLDGSGQSLAVSSSATMGTTGFSDVDAVVVGEALAMLDSGAPASGRCGAGRTSTCSYSPTQPPRGC